VSEEGGLWARQMNGGIAGEESARVVGDASGCVVVDPGDGRVL
jgi:fructose-1,6-bisphosphatase/inositol monophosphatase family enzyme